MHTRAHNTGMVLKMWNTDIPEEYSTFGARTLELEISYTVDEPEMLDK